MPSQQDSWERRYLFTPIVNIAFCHALFSVCPHSVLYLAALRRYARTDIAHGS